MRNIPETSERDEEWSPNQNSQQKGKSENFVFPWEECFSQDNFPWTVISTQLCSSGHSRGLAGEE
jgi:hypothetical protein